jgi:Asp-tRNA(Asn)/Glu-tRNA(Gln) amidotransferase A subunit family amidase
LVEHAADWAAQPQHFSPELAKLLRYAEKQGAVAYAAALREVAEAHAEVARWWQMGEVMLLPTAPQTAFAFGTPVPANQADFSSIASMAGVPALSLPLPGAPGALPVGLQCMAAYGGDATLLALQLQGVVA